MARDLTQPVHAYAATGIRIYVPVAIFTVLVAFVGFWSRYYGRILDGTVTTPAIIQFHAAVFVGWLALLITQATFAARGRMDLHMKVGRYVMAYGVVVAAMGLIASFAAFEIYLLAGNAPKARSVLFIGITDILAFVPFLAAAWFYRRRPEFHKRLIIVATCILLIAPVHRMHWFLGGPPAPVAAVLLIWLAPIYAGMIHDFVTRRIVHPVYLVGILAIVSLKFWRNALSRTDAWNAFADWVTQLYASPTPMGG